MSSWKVAAILTFLLGWFATPGYGVSVTLQWDANVESDLQGYKVYYHAGPAAPPYTGSGANEGDSPILADADEVKLGNTCRFTLTGLEDANVYYFVVTAYDDKGLESGYSNEVYFVPSDDPFIYQVVPRHIDCSYRDSHGIHWNFLWIFGLNFGKDQGNGEVVVGPYPWWDVDLGGAPLTQGFVEPFVAWSDDLIKVGFVVPTGWELTIRGKTTAVWVRKDGMYSNPNPFVVETCDQLR